MRKRIRTRVGRVEKGVGIAVQALEAVVVNKVLCYGVFAGTYAYLHGRECCERGRGTQGKICFGR